MSTVWERVASALGTLNVPAVQNQWIAASGQERPDQYLVYFLVASPIEQSADNHPTEISYRMQVAAYSRDGFSNLPDVDGAMTAAGFAIGPKRELPYNPSTRHFGLAMEYVALKE